jgi:hypothetical protein
MRIDKDNNGWWFGMTTNTGTPITVFIPAKHAHARSVAQRLVDTTLSSPACLNEDTIRSIVTAASGIVRRRTFDGLDRHQNLERNVDHQGSNGSVTTNPTPRRFEADESRERFRLLTATDLERVIGVKARTIRHWAQTGDFCAPVIDRDRCKLWHPADVLAWLQQRRSVSGRGKDADEWLLMITDRGVWLRPKKRL